MMSKKNLNSAPLTQDEIEEELLNNELLNSGAAQNRGSKNPMDTEDNRRSFGNLSRGDNNKFPPLEIRNRLSLDHSSDNFPSLSEASQKPHNKLKLQKKPGPSILVLSDDSQDGSVKLTNEEEHKPKFKLPFCVSDGAPPIPIPERSLRRNNNPYFVRPNEKPYLAVKRMIAHHDSWRAEYTKEMSRPQIQDSGDTSDEEAEEDKICSPRNTRNEIEDSDDEPHLFKSNSLTISSYKTYRTEAKVNSSQSTSKPLLNSSRTLQRKTSRDSDCEEVEPVLKSEEPKLSEWLVVGPNRPKTKRNKKQLLNEEKNKSSSPVEVHFDFENKWDANRSSWGESSSASSFNVQPRRGLRASPVVEEQKVQCPICQKNFSISKVENHAATCEGFSPMDVEEES